MSTPAQARFLLVDGVLQHDAIARLYRRGEPLDIEPLYIGTRFKELHPLGPILVSLQGPPGTISQDYPDASLLHSNASRRVVADHLRHFLAPYDALGGTGLLRFADPITAQYWLGSYPSAHLDAVLGPIEAWHVPHSQHRWEPDAPHGWQSFLRTAPAPAWTDSTALLGEPQLRALDLGARWRYLERLQRFLEHSHPEPLARIANNQLTSWFHERLDEAQAFGLVSERSLAIWVEYSLRWGAGFTQHTNGPYQQWLDRTPTALSLAPALRIQQMDNDCLHIDIDIDKDAQ